MDYKTVIVLVIAMSAFAVSAVAAEGNIGITLTHPFPIGIKDYHCGILDSVCPEDYDKGTSDTDRVICDILDPDCKEVCDDTKDNDGDLAKDCADSDCCRDPACVNIFTDTIDEIGGSGPNQYTYRGVDYDAGVNGVNESAFNWICCGDDYDSDGDSLDDNNDPNCVAVAATYGGYFNNQTTTGDSVTFFVNFTDESSPLTVKWDFYYTESCNISPTIVYTTESKNDFVGKTTIKVGNLTVFITPAGYCQVLMTAVNDPNGASVQGEYILKGSQFSASGPSMVIPEIPAVIHPTNLYSNKKADAEKAYSSASVAVLSLQTSVLTCTPSCDSAKAKFSEAQTHLKAAEFYMGGCTDGQVACQLSQYYSIMAKLLASEGSSLLV